MRAIRPRQLVVRTCPPHLRELKIQLQLLSYAAAVPGAGAQVLRDISKQGLSTGEQKLACRVPFVYL